MMALGSLILGKSSPSRGDAMHAACSRSSSCLAAAVYSSREVVTTRPARDAQALDPARGDLRPRQHSPGTARARCTSASACSSPLRPALAPDRAPGQPARRRRRSIAGQAARRRPGPHDLADRASSPRRALGVAGGLVPRLSLLGGALRRRPALLFALALRRRGLHRPGLRRLAAGPRRRREADSRPSCPTRSTCSPSASRPASASTARSRS